MFICCLSRTYHYHICLNPLTTKISLVILLIDNFEYFHYLSAWSRSLVGLKGLKWGISLYFNDFIIIIFNIVMLSNVTKKCGENVM